MAVDRGERGFPLPVQQLESVHPMSTQKIFVITHKKIFDIYDCSE